MKRSDDGAVARCHSEFATAMSAVRKPVPAIAEEMSQLIGRKIPSISVYFPAGRYMELA